MLINHSLPEGEQRWRLVVIEDADELLRQAARQGVAHPLSRVLKLIDGLVGQSLRALLLLTTKEPVARLFPEIVGSSRTLSSIEFTAFSATEATQWLGTDHPGPATAMTIAELAATRGDATGRAERKPDPTGLYL